MVLLCAFAPFRGTFVAVSQDPIETIRIDSDLVDLKVSVLGFAPNEAPPLLEPKDFLVLEDGVPQEISFFAAADAPFDLLLTDVIVPGPMNGKALADEVQRRWPGTKLVFMSGYSENILSTQGRLASGVLLLNKPFRKHELAKMLRTALDAPVGQGAS